MSTESGSPSINFKGWTTQSGRPLGELNAEREIVVQAMDQDIQMREMRCEIDDSRNGGWTNLDALEDVRSRFHQTLRFMAGVNVKYFGETQPNLVTNEDAIALAQVCVSMPGYLILRREYQAQGELPNIIGDVFKITAGLYAAFTYFDIASEEEDLSFNARSVYALMNKHEMLKNRERVCPAPPSMIIRTIDALVMRNGVSPDTESVDSLFPDFNDLLSFGDVDTSVEFLSTPLDEF